MPFFRALRFAAASAALSLTLAACGGVSTTGAGSSTSTTGATDPAGTGTTTSTGTGTTTGTTTATSSSASLAFSAASLSATQSAGSVTITVARSGSTQAASSVSYQTQDGTAAAGTNYTAASGTLSWQAGDTAAKTFKVMLSSAAFTGSKTFSVALTSPSGATLGTPATLTVTVQGSGTAAASAAVALSTASQTVAQASGQITVTVNRTGSGAASVSYVTTNGTAKSGTDYTAASGSLIWTSNDSAAKTITVALSKTAFSGTRNFSITLQNPAGATLGSPASEMISIQGSTTAATGTIALSAATDSVAQSAGRLSLTATRSAGSSGAASVSYATADGTAKAGTDYKASSGTLSWAAGDASSKTISVTLGTTAFSGSRTFTVTLSAAKGAALGTPANATVTISGTGNASSLTVALAAKLGKPSRLLVGLGGQGGANIVTNSQSQDLTVDIYDEYLGLGDWTTWSSPPCDWVCQIFNAADTLNAVPMYTQYQMANIGDGNLSGLSQASFMNTYWSRAKLALTEIGARDKPALINLEPDFWGYVERQAPGGDPTKMTVLVSSNADCPSMANNVQGFTSCFIAMTRKYAPKAYVGLPISEWGGDTDTDIVTFMNAVGAQHADFIVEQTLDRDAGCDEKVPQPSECQTPPAGLYWDETNQTHPNFHDHLATVQTHHAGIGGLPVIWWQTPLGVPSTTPGGTDYHYRDNRVHYFLTHPTELTAVGGLGVVFGAGESHQTNFTTDGGQFQILNGQYFAKPAPLQ